MQRPVIVLSAHNIGLGVARALGRHRIPIIAVYYEKRDMGYVSRYVRERVPAPHPEQSEEAFVSLLIDLAKRHGSCLLIPADDPTLVATSRHKAELSEHHKVACADWDTVQQLIDKKYTYQLAESLGIPAPKTLVPNSMLQAEAFAARATYPCLVKPCQSHLYVERFGRKLLKVADVPALLSACSEAFEAGLEVMLQEYIPGGDIDGVNYNSYSCDGEVKVEFTAEKVRMSPPEFGVPSVVVSKDVPEVLESGRRLLYALGYTGYACTEFRRDIRDGVYKLLEINPRHNRSLLLAVKCGINFPLIEYKHLIEGQELPSIGHPPKRLVHDRGLVPHLMEKQKPLYTQHKRGIYWIDTAKDLAAIGEYRKRGQLSILRYVQPYLKRPVFATLDIRDPLPFLKRCADLLRMARRATISKTSKSEEQSTFVGADT